MASDGKNTRGRWQLQPTKWESDDAERAAAEDFERAARRLIRGDTPQAKLSEFQVLAEELAGFLAACARSEPDAETEDWLRVCVRTFMEEPTLRTRRCRAMQSIASCCQHLSRTQDPELERRILDALRWNLGTCDPGLAQAYADDDGLELLASQVSAYDPKPAGKRGAKSPETILAEMIVLDVKGGALGFRVSRNEPVKNQIEDIRSDLARDGSRKK